MTLKDDTKQVMIDLFAFIFINDMDVILGDFYVKFFVRPTKDGNKIIKRGEYLCFKFTVSENKAAILWVTIFFISWIYLEIFFVIETLYSDVHLFNTNMTIYGNAIIDTYVNGLDPGLCWYFSANQINLILIQEIFVFASPFIILIFENYFKLREMSKT